MTTRDPIGRNRRGLRRRFVGSTFVTTTGSTNITVPAGVDSYDAFVAGAGAAYAGGVGGASGGLSIRRNRSIAAGSTITLTVGAAGQTTTVDGIAVYPASGTTPGYGIGGDVNLTGSPNSGANAGALPSPAWSVSPVSYFGDSGGPYIHPLYKGLPGVNSGLPGAGGTSTAAPGTGSVFFIWYVTEAA